VINEDFEIQLESAYNQHVG